MADRVRALGTPGGLEVGQQVELAAVVGPVVMAAQRHDAQRVAAPAQRPRDQVRRVDPAGGRAPDGARAAGDGEALRLAGGEAG